MTEHFLADRILADEAARNDLLVADDAARNARLVADATGPERVGQ